MGEPHDTWQVRDQSDPEARNPWPVVWGVFYLVSTLLIFVFIFVFLAIGNVDILPLIALFVCACAALSVKYIRATETSRKGNSRRLLIRAAYLVILIALAASLWRNPAGNFWFVLFMVCWLLAIRLYEIRVRRAGQPKKSHGPPRITTV